MLWTRASPVPTGGISWTLTKGTNENEHNKVEETFGKETNLICSKEKDTLYYPMLE